MMAEATVAGLFLGFATQAISNGVTKLPIMRHRWEYFLAMGLGVAFTNILVKCNAQLQIDLDKKIEGFSNRKLFIVLVCTLILWIVSLIKLVFGQSFLSTSGVPFVSEGKLEELNPKSVLLVIAHPDDESMFFIPTIRYLTSECRQKLYILCISTGNAEGKGHVRKEELLKACLVLKVPVSNITILDHEDLQDGFDKPWSYNLLAQIIKDTVTAFDIDLIITFDNHGISGHPQHRAVYCGVCNFLKEVELSEGRSKIIDAWELRSSNIIRKYSGPLDIWYSILNILLFGKEDSYCLFNRCPHLCFLAMAQHRSQWLWYRKLFVIFSSYGYVNTLRRIKYSA